MPWLKSHEDDIANGINDFGELKPVYDALFFEVPSVNRTDESFGKSIIDDQEFKEAQAAKTAEWREKLDKLLTDAGPKEQSFKDSIQEGLDRKRANK
jgi:hypothetical protein